MNIEFRSQIKNPKLKKKVINRCKEILESCKTKFKKIEEPVDDSGLSVINRWITTKKQKIKLYGNLQVISELDQTKAKIFYNVVKGYSEVYLPKDLDEKNPKKGAVPFSKKPILDKKIEVIAVQK